MFKKISTRPKASNCLTSTTTTSCQGSFRLRRSCSFERGSWSLSCSPIWLLWNSSEKTFRTTWISLRSPLRRTSIDLSTPPTRGLSRSPSSSSLLWCCTPVISRRHSESSICRSSGLISFSRNSLIKETWRRPKDLRSAWCAIGRAPTSPAARRASSSSWCCQSTTS